jgi:hypothetical protein
MLNISGTIGLSILENQNNKIFIFYDDHQNKKYCKDNFFINNLLNNIIKDPKYNKDTCLILEEPFIKNSDKIKILWSDSKHLMYFRKFYSKIINKCGKDKVCFGFPADIRLSLLDISIEEIMDNVNVNKYEIKIMDYFKYIIFLFDIEHIIIENNNIINFLKKVFSTYTKSIYYIELEKKIINFYNKFIKDNKNIFINSLIKTLSPEHYNFKYNKGYPFIKINDIYFFDEIDKILSGIMEFFIIIMIKLLPYKFKFIYAGYYHSNNIKHILINTYNYKLITEYGITENIETINEKTINNCINVDEKYFT